MSKKKICAVGSITIILLLLGGCGTDPVTIKDTEALSAVLEQTGQTEQTETNSQEDTEKAEETEEAEDMELIQQEEETEGTEPVSQEEELTDTEAESDVAVDTEVEAVEEEDNSQNEETYTFTELSAIMYALKSVNVRALPSTDGTRLGSLQRGQEVTITGQCNETSWYRICFGDGEGFVSNNYLVADKPAEEATPVQPEEPIVSPPIEASPMIGDNGLVTISTLANKKSLQKKCTDEEFQAAYDAAAQIVTPLIGLSREEQLYEIAIALREMVDSGQVAYSTEAAHYNDPYGYFVAGVASCSGCTRATGLCLNMLNIDYEHVNEGQWSHQWCRVNLDGTYWICDAYGLYVGPEPEPYMHPYL